MMAEHDLKFPAEPLEPSYRLLELPPDLCTLFESSAADDTLR